MLRSTRTKVFVLLLIAGLSSWMLFRTGVVQGLGAPKPVFSQICAGPGLQPPVEREAAAVEPSSVQHSCGLSK